MAKKKRSNTCKQSTLNKIETKIYDILTKLNVKFKTQATIDKYNVDFLVDDKYIIECYGDFWHCNPQRYSPSYFNKGKRKTAEEIWKRDNCRKEKFEELGYKFLHLWESEINDNVRLVSKKIKKYIRQTR